MATRGQVLFVPPFNEEMNRCRSMVTQQAQAFAGMGFGALVIDPHGTGDSEGEFRDARWALWLQDIEAAYAWLTQQPGGCRAMVGIRLGAILAAQALQRLQSPGLALALWQPVIDGKTHLTQFLRVRMAAQLDRPQLPKETTASMRQQLASGTNLEVAGYEIHPELAAAIDDARLRDYAPPPSTPVAWLENAPGDKLEPAPASQTVLADWEAQGNKATYLPFAGPAFWQVHERVVAPAIIEQTTTWLAKAMETA